MPYRDARPLRNRKWHIGRTRPLAAAVTGLAVVLLAGCAGGASSAGSVSGTITIAAAPGVDDAPLYMAAQDGTFKAAGLNVEIKNFGSQSAELAAVEGGQAEIAATDYANIFEQQASLPVGNLRILADGYDAGTGSVEILINPNIDNLTSPAQLQQSVIGLPSDSLLSSSFSASATNQAHPDSLIAAAATAVIANYLASAADTLRWQSMSQQQEVDELQSGQLKAALLTEPYIYEAESGFGATELVDAFSGETAGLPLTGYVATSSWVKANPAAVADFQSAISKAQAGASMVGPVQRALPKLPGFPAMTTAAAEMVSIGTYPTTTSATALSRVLQLLTLERMLAVKPSHEISVAKMLVRS